MKKQQLPDISTMTHAYLSRDVEYDGLFFTGVKTTGIFCRPTCKAKSPLPKNVEFFATGANAIQAGFRPCKMCRPLDPAGKPPPWVKPVLDAIDADPSRRWTDEDLMHLGVDAVRTRRWFKSNYGVTFHAFSRARRLGNALGQIKSGSSVIHAAYDQGYDSLSGFNDAFKKLLGTAPKVASTATPIFVKRIATPLGLMFAAASDAHVYLLEFMDRRAIERQLLTLQRRAGATILQGETELHGLIEKEVAAYFAGTLKSFSLPLASPGTAFQQQVWKALRTIPYGETRTYADIAKQMGNRTAVRAVANANGVNRLAIVIPCHRVIGSDGKLTGYGGGLWRKKRLLEIEGMMVAEQLKLV